MNNGVPTGANVLTLPEPISIPRTQNLSARIKLPPEVYEMIGNVAAPGVGSPLQPYNFTYLGVAGEPPVPDPIDVLLQYPPYKVQIGLQGRRVKDTQYGQIAPGAPRA